MRFSRRKKCVVGLQALHFSKDFDTMLSGKPLAMLTDRGIMANWVRTWQNTDDLMRLLSAFMGTKGKDLQTCSPHLPCRAGEHLVPLMETGKQGKRTLQLLCWPGWLLSPAASWKFPKGFAQLGYFSRKLSWVEGTLFHHHPGFRVSASSPRDNNVFVSIMFEFVCVAQGMAGAALKHKVQSQVLGRSQHNCWESN